MLDFGKLIASGPTAEVLRDEHVIRAYLGTEEVRVSSRHVGPRLRLRLEDLSVARGGRAVVAATSPSRSRRAQVTRCSAPNGAGKSTLVLAVGGRAAPERRPGARSATASSRACRPEQVRAAGVAVVPEGRRLLPALTVEDNLRVATYSLGARRRRRAGVAHALELFPELEKRWSAHGAPALRRRAADGRARAGARLAAAVRARRRALARPRPGGGPAARAGAASPWPRAASACS